MAHAETANASTRQKKGKLPLILGFLGAILFGVLGFYTGFKGLIPLHIAGTHGDDSIPPLPDIAFLALDPIVISLGPQSSSRHLRFVAQLEVSTANLAEVALVKPRIIDVLNSYLRAVDLSTLEDPSAMVRMKAQMSRRIQLVSGEGRVRDLLISEFVLN